MWAHPVTRHSGPRGDNECVPWSSLDILLGTQGRSQKVTATLACHYPVTPSVVVRHCPVSSGVTPPTHCVTPAVDRYVRSD